jgi:hypothetical protein
VGEKSSSHDGVSDWGDFPETVLHFDSIPTVVVDLRRHIGPTVLAEIRGTGLERSFGIVTAHDPMGVTQTKDVNAMLATRLRTEIAELHVPYVRVDACSPDRSHCEQSVAVELGLQQLIDLACRYDQLALFWFDGVAFWIVPARSANARTRLPVSR